MNPHRTLVGPSPLPSRFVQRDIVSMATLTLSACPCLVKVGSNLEQDGRPNVLAAQAFTNMMIDEQRQAILISGESGAGKTESAKMVKPCPCSLSCRPNVSRLHRRTVIYTVYLLRSLVRIESGHEFLANHRPELSICYRVSATLAHVSDHRQHSLPCSLRLT